MSRNELGIKKIDDTNISSLKSFISKYNQNKPLKVVDLYCKNGYNGFLALINNTIIGYIWWVDNKVDLKLTHPSVIRCGLTLKDDYVYTFDYYIASEFRGKGIALEVLSLIQSELKKLGYNKAIGGVVHYNLPAIFTYNVQGWKIMKELTFIELFSFILLSKGKIFLKNKWWNTTHNFDYKLILTFP